MMDFVKFCALVTCLFGLAIAIHRWSVKKGHPNTTEWAAGALRACTIGVVLVVCFYAVTGKMPYEKQTIVRSYDDPFKREHELARELAEAEAIKMAKRKAIPDVNIQTILSEYTKNEINADNLYKGKTLRIAGIVLGIQKDIQGKPFVILGKDEIVDIPLIQASFSNSYNMQLANLNQGDRLTVVCEVLGLLLHVQIANCEIEPS